MTSTAELIKEAYIVSLVNDPMEELEGYQSSEGLNMLNRILDQWSSLQIYIPTFNLVPITTVAGTYTYTITPIITNFLEGQITDSNNVQTNLHQIDLKTQNLTKYEPSDTARARPQNIFIQNAQANVPVATSTVYLSPVPDQVYTATLYVKQVMGNLTYSQTILNIPPRCFIALIMELGKQLSIRYRTVLSPDFQEEYDRVIQELKAANKKDLSVANTNPLWSHRRYRPWGGMYVG